MTLIPEEVLEEFLQKMAAFLQSDPSVKAVDLTDLHADEGWAAWGVIVRLPEQDPTGRWQ